MVEEATERNNPSPRVEVGQVGANVLIQVELPLLHQLQHHHRGELRGDGPDLEHGVQRRLDVELDVRVSVRLVVQDIPTSGHRDAQAGHPTVLHVRGHHRVDGGVQEAAIQGLGTRRQREEEQQGGGEESVS